MKEQFVISTYYQKQIHTIEIILKKRHRKISEQDVHQLRVAVKKVKAISDVIHFSKPDFRRKKFMRSFKRIFKAAGKLRDIQLEITRLKQFQVFDSLKDYSHHLNKQLKKRKHIFFSLANEQMRRKLQKKSRMIFPYFEYMSTNQVNRFLEEKSNQVTRIMESSNLKEREAHQLRKMLKEFYYTTSIFGEKEKQFKNLDDFQELLGQWHNDSVLEDYLQNAIDTGHAHKKELKIISETNNKISFERELLFEKIKTRVHHIGSSLLKFESRPGIARQTEPY